MKESKQYPVPGKLSREALAAVLAQIVHYAWDDYAGNQELPEVAMWTTSYICSCFLAQHTDEGEYGVETEYPLARLKIAESMSYADRLALAIEAVLEMEKPA